MEESPCKQFRGDRHKGMLPIGQGTLLQIRVLTGKGLQVNQRLTEALESGAYLNPKQLAFLADNGDRAIPAQASQ
ncbi:hypothetical protein Tco_0022805 [Tanacetum coccineum]